MENEETKLYAFGRSTNFRVTLVEDTPETKEENEDLRQAARHLQNCDCGFQRSVWSEKVVNGRTVVTFGGFSDIVNGFVESLVADRTNILKFSAVPPPVRIGNGIIYVSQMSLKELKQLVGKLQTALYDEMQRSNFVKFMKVKRLNEPRFREVAYYRTLIHYYNSMWPKKCEKVFQLSINFKGRFPFQNS